MLVDFMIELNDWVVRALFRTSGEKDVAIDAVSRLRRQRIFRKYFCHRRIKRKPVGVVCSGRSQIDRDRLLYTVRIGVGVVEFPRKESRRRHGCLIRQGGQEAIHFIVEKEECSIFNDWTANREPELMTNIGIHRSTVRTIGGIKPVACATKSVPTSEVVRVAVQAVGAALGDNVDDRAGISAVFGVKVVSDDAKL